MRTKQITIWAVIILFFAAFSCSTKKNTQMSRAFHNLNAHYNVYFNAGEALKSGVEKIESNYTDNYTDVLSIYKFGDKTSAAAGNGDMETVLKKTAKLVKKHSIKKKPKRKNKRGKMSKKEKEFYSKSEYNKWVDDAYLLMGKAHYYKMEYLQAIRVFEYIIQNYDDELLKTEAQLWIARTYNEMKDFRNSGTAIDALNSMTQDDRLKKEAALVNADYYLKQDLYKEAVPRLKIAIEATKRKRNKCRLTFIMAQIYQKQENNKKARELYAQIPKLNPTYEMLFNANINLAIAFSGNSKSSDIEKELEKMLRDEKNEEFKDQIYYALANIYYKKGDFATAKEYYRLSSAISRQNRNQKAISCLALADIYFDEPEYSLAQAYYDSTVLNLDKEYPNYEEIYLKTKNLTSLVNSLTTIRREDSLQAIATLPDDQRLKVIDQKIQNYKSEQARIKAEQAAGKRSNLDPVFDADIRRQNTGNTSLPFYNPTALARGIDMFKRKWGNRKLEDNWRRSNKTIVMANNSEENENSEEKSNEFTPEDQEYYLVDLPLNDSLMQVSKEKVEKAYYNAGEVYMDKLEDYTEAIAIFEEMNKRFPKGNYLLDSYYFLYKMNKNMGNKEEENKYKNLIISKFPESSHAKLFTNPNYLQELQADKKKVDNIYLQAYNKYKNNDYGAAVNISKEALSKFPENYMEPKFDLLIALSQGAIASPDASVLQKGLKEVIKKHPKSDEAAKADEMLQVLNKTKGEELSEETSIYSDAKSKSYYYVLILKNSFNVNRIEFDIAKFNIDNFSRVDFIVRNKDLRKSEKMILVSGINDFELAKEYFTKIKTAKELRNDLSMENFEEFIISEKNLKTFELDKNADRYINFMNKKLGLK